MSEQWFREYVLLAFRIDNISCLIASWISYDCSDPSPAAGDSPDFEGAG